MCVLTFIHLSILVEQFSLGNQGEDQCPIGYIPIKDPTECEAAAQEFEYVWDGDSGVRDTDSVCNYCAGCSSNHVRLSSNHGDAAFWICKIGKLWIIANYIVTLDIFNKLKL